VIGRAAEKMGRIIESPGEIHHTRRQWGAILDYHRMLYSGYRD
jgi:hypothetical protein